MDNDIFDRLYRQHYVAALLYAQGLCRARARLRKQMEEDGYEF